MRLGVRSPAIGFGIEIVMIEKAGDVGHQGPDAAKASRADDLGGDFAKEAFHQIEPRGRGGNEMDVETGMTFLSEASGSGATDACASTTAPQDTSASARQGQSQCWPPRRPQPC
jgi:hypothetical protein